MKEPTVTIPTDRCLLRLATLLDYDALVAGIGAPEFPRELPLADVYQQGKLKAWLGRNLTTPADRRACLLSIDLRTGERCIGQVSLAQRDQSESWNLAYWLNPSHWGRGLALEAAAATLRYGFTVLEIQEVWAGAALWNQRSIRTLVNLGLLSVKEGETRRNEREPQQAIRTFSISRDDWLALPVNLRQQRHDI